MADDKREPREVWTEAMGSVYRMAEDLWYSTPYEMARSNGTGRKKIAALREFLDRAEEALD